MPKPISHRLAGCLMDSRIRSLSAWLEEGVTDDATDAWSNRRNLAAIATRYNDASRHGLAAHSVSGQQILPSRTREGREGSGGIHHDKVKVLARYRSVHESHGTALSEHLLKNRSRHFVWLL